MSDPLSIAGSVAGLITISAQIVGMAKELFDKVKDAPETVVRVREEVESMQPIFCQVQLLLNGAGSRPNNGNLTMISVHNLMITLTGCVIVYSRLEKKVNETCGFNDPTTASATWKRAGVIADRVKWGLWRHKEVLLIIEDLQRQKLGLNLMLTILSCTTTAEASEVQARLLELSTGILQSNHAHSVLLRDLISRQDAASNRQDEQARVILNRQDEQARVLNEIRSYTSTLGVTGNSAAVSTPPPSAGSHSVNYGSSDNASIMSKRSILSLRLGRPTYLEDLKASRAYKRLRHFGLGTDSSTDSIFSFDSACSTGNWSMLSDITLGDLSVSAIAVLNLPIDLSDVSNAEPFQARSSMRAPRAPKSRTKRSSRGRIHNAIENGNGFVIRTLLAIGIDIEERDSNGRTPLVHAAMKRQEAICELLLEKGASVEAFTNSMGSEERSELLDPSIKKALDDGSTPATVLRLLVQMALGTNYGDDNRSLSRPMMSVAVDMSYELVVRAIIHLDPQVLVEVDKEGRTPFSYAYYLRRNDICQILLEYLTLEEAAKDVVGMKLGTGLVDDAHDAIVVDCPKILELVLAVDASIEKLYTEKYGQTFFVVAFSLRRPKVCEMLLQNTRFKVTAAPEDLKLGGNLAGHFRFAIQEKCPRVLDLLLATGVDIEKIDVDGQTLLAYAAEAVLNSEDNRYKSWNYICKTLLDKASPANIEEVKKIRAKPGARQWITGSMHELVNKEYKPLLVLLSLMDSRDAEGWTPLASAAFNLNESLCKLLMEKGYSLFLDTEHKDLRSKLSCRIHGAAKRGHKTALQLLLDMGADINERNSDGKIALLEAVISDHLSCVKLLIERGADCAISTSQQATILHCAALCPSDQHMKFLLDDVVETRKLVDVKDSDGDTALHACSLSDYRSPAIELENAKILLQAGASITIKNKQRQTPYELAWYQHRKELARYLWSQLSPQQQAREIHPPSDWW